MTERKHLKNRIRARMRRTGERYTTARRHTLAGSTSSQQDTVPGPPQAPIGQPNHDVVGHAYVSVAGTYVTVLAQAQVLTSLAAALTRSGAHYVIEPADPLGLPPMAASMSARSPVAPNDAWVRLHVSLSGWSRLDLDGQDMLVPDHLRTPRGLIAPAVFNRRGYADAPPRGCSPSDPGGRPWLRLIVQ